MGSSAVTARARTSNAIGLSVQRIMQGQHGVEDVSLSLPSLINADGIAAILELPVSDGEVEALRSSARTLKEARAQLDI